jgi:L-cysteine:1D-myo-inositol 2-amino-2-deoxy-alpha-D-glucopyranoside ligase
VLATVRERMAEDLDAPGALAAIDAWADAALSDAALADGGGADGPAGDAALIRDTADALLGVAL